MSGRGWIKLWRKSLDSGILQNHKLWAFWCYCLIKATHKPTKQMVGWQVVELQPGQFVFGRQRAAEELSMSESQIRSCIKSLKKIGSLTIKTTNKFSVITIVNWSAYQICAQQDDQQDDQQLTGRRPASDHKQEFKNLNNVYKRESPEGDSSSNSPTSLAHKRIRQTAPECPQKEILAIYHEECPELPVTEVWGDTSQKNLRARWQEEPERQSLEWWRQFFKEKVITSDFLAGRVKEFQADLGWIVQQRNFQGIMNGRYANKGINRTAAPKSGALLNWKTRQNLEAVEAFIYGN